MEASDKIAFREIVESLFSAFDKEATKQLFLAYWWGLQDMQLADIQRAAVLAMQRCKFMPKPVELRELVEGSSEARAELAWMDAQSAVSLGAYKHIAFRDVTINAVIRALGGWPAFVWRFTDATEEKWIRGEFLRAYQRLHGQVLSDEAYAYLPGETQMQSHPILTGRLESEQRRVSTVSRQSALAVNQKAQACIGVLR